jgi:hypothetical protein
MKESMEWKTVITSLLRDSSTRPPSKGTRNLPSFLLFGTTSPPLRVKFFTWLLVQNRIQCKSNLMKKSILEDDAWELCNGGSEDADHISSRDALSPKVSGTRLGGRAAKLLMWRLSGLLELHQEPV